ncbi:MAG: hypothetical protein UY49_C0002G0016 [Microgenomates group bacterium GW2011_GWC1_49_7]|nr:MAG: hypothetical protein UY49_C0002G0016 [Microgenomates group bacterium GW2011_GWC1_49_7]
MIKAMSEVFQRLKTFLINPSDQDLHTERMKHEYPEVARSLHAIAQTIWLDPSSTKRKIATAFALGESIGVTSAHVVENWENFTYLHLTAQGAKHPVPLSEPFIFLGPQNPKIIDAHANFLDFAIFHIPKGARLSPIVEWRRPSVDEKVFCLGFPPPENKSQTLYRKPAIIAGTVVDIDGESIQIHPDLITIRPEGTSGGPVVDAQGRLLGVQVAFDPRIRDIYATTAQTISTTLLKLHNGGQFK